MDFFFIDDMWTDAPSEVKGWEAMGLTERDLREMTAAWQENMAAVQAATLARGGMNWQLFLNNATDAGPPFKESEYGPPTSAECTRYMRGVACRADSPLQHQPLFYGVERNADWRARPWLAPGRLDAPPHTPSVFLDTKYGKGRLHDRFARG